MISPGRLWWLLRRDARRGWDASRHYYKTLPRILEWSWPFWSEPVQGIPVHLLTGREDWRNALWALASWFHYSEHAWPVVIHDDGTLPAEGADAFRKLFRNVRIIPRDEADKALATVLKPYPFCSEYRDMHSLALKIFDIPHFAQSDRFIVLDSDVLFFSHPRAILDWSSASTAECWFNEDAAEGSLITEQEAADELGVKLWKKVNSGLCLLHRPALDLDFCDRALAQTTILRGHVWRVEQTLFALCASRHCAGGLLPPQYEVSLSRKASPDAISRHYVGAVRDRFHAEGLKRLAPVLLAAD